jgi:hypothetical protein
MTHFTFGPQFRSSVGGSLRVSGRETLSPLLFNIVADGLTHMVLRAQVNSRIIGLISH